MYPAFLLFELQGQHKKQSHAWDFRFSSCPSRVRWCAGAVSLVQFEWETTEKLYGIGWETAGGNRVLGVCVFSNGGLAETKTFWMLLGWQFQMLTLRWWKYFVFVNLLCSVGEIQNHMWSRSSSAGVGESQRVVFPCCPIKQIPVFWGVSFLPLKMAKANSGALRILQDLITVRQNECSIWM